MDTVAEVYQALVLGTRDYVRRTAFKSHDRFSGGLIRLYGRHCCRCWERKRRRHYDAVTV
jgi:hypothetical protein